MKKLTLLLSIILAAALLLTACVKPTPTEAPVVPAPPEVEEPVAVEPPAESPTEEISLVVWDQFYRDVESQVIETLNAEFEAAHPGVKIERVVKTLDDLKVTLKLALAETDGPDVAQVNQGRSDMGAMVEAGLLLPLDDYTAAFNWGERFSASVASRNSFTEDGKTFGSGNLYGVSPTAEVVGVYYNKTLFEANGWVVPTTFDEFEALLATIKAAGITPISFGSLDGWNAIHEFSAVQHLLVSLDYINDFTYGVNNVSFDIPENQQAAAVMQTWVDNGYFTDGFAGIGYDDSNKTFKAGEGAMTITGSWLTGELLTETDQEFGFFLLPGNPGQTRLAIGGVGVPFSIRKTTAQPDLAAEYLDWMISPRAAELWAGVGMLPAMPMADDADVEVDPLFTDTMVAWNTVNEENAVGHYIDWATPTFYDTIVAELQKLFGKVSTPAEFTAAVEVDYAAFLSGN